MTWMSQRNYHSPSAMIAPHEAADKPVSDFHGRCSKKHTAKNETQVRPLCVEFYRWSNKESRGLFARKGQNRRLRKGKQDKGVCRVSPAHANSQRPATPFALFQGVTF